MVVHSIHSYSVETDGSAFPRPNPSVSCSVTDQESGVFPSTQENMFAEDMEEFKRKVGVVIVVHI